MKAIREGQLECPEMPHYETVYMMQLMDNIRAAWDISFPYEVERLDSDPEEDPKVVARREEAARRFKEQEELRKRMEEMSKKAENENSTEEQENQDSLDDLPDLDKVDVNVESLPDEN